MTEKKNLVKLAKGTEIKKKNNVPKKLKVEEKLLTPEEERDLKAKETVNKLLSDSEIFAPTIENKENLLEINGEANKSFEWLEEQIALLSEENTKLKNELEIAKSDYGKIFTEFQKIKQDGNVILSNPEVDSTLKLTIIKLFNEIQTNHLALGRNFVIIPPAFLNRLIMFFPFLQNEKRF